MVHPVKQRQATVVQTKQLLEAVSYIRQQKQIPNVDRICRYMQREYKISYAECQRQLDSVVADGFILEYTAVAVKGARTGLEQEGYRIPAADEIDLMRDGHDWYCFECHSPGELLLCTECFRAYHISCTKEDYSGARFICSVCKEIETGKMKKKMKKKMLNTLLSYTILRLREKTKELVKIGTKIEEGDFSRFVYQRMDLNTMEGKVQASRYKCSEEFFADAQTIHHNCVLIYGDSTPGGMTDLAKIMLSDCKYDLDEIDLCANCYYMSNAKPENWFCQPCSPPHDLVYAKLKGFGYWPAKVINEVDGKMDVRFFGGWHQRAVIPAEYIRPVLTDINKLAIKKTAGFTKAMKELKIHQDLLKEREHEQQNEEIENDRKEFPDADQEESNGRGALVDFEKEKEEFEEEIDVRQVTSTSVDTNRKRKFSSFKAAAADESFVVTSSEDKVIQARSPKPLLKVAVTSTPSQTSKLKTHVIGTQTSKADIIEENDKNGEEAEEPAQKKLHKVYEGRSRYTDEEWQARLDETMKDVTQQLNRQHEENKTKALKELTEKLKKDFEEDKQAAVARAMTNVSREIEKARKAAEDKCKEQYMEEMKKLAQKHKEAISATKKKQWCFNCEEEAMYHCCWNTSYCSVRCQQEHWHKEHKRVCRRKR